MTGLMHVDEAMAGQPGQLAEIDHAFDVLRLRGLYFNVDSLSRHGFPWPLDAPQMEAFWDKIARSKSSAAPPPEPFGGLIYLRRRCSSSRGMISTKLQGLWR